MKKTKYISIAYLLFITTTILITFIDAKAHYKLKKTSNNKIEVSNKNLNDFKIVVAAKKTRLLIVKDTINQLEESFFIPKDTINGGMAKFDKKVAYRIDGDTLFIDKTYARSVTLKAKNIEQIISKNKSNIDLSNYSSKTLHIDSDNANVHGNNNNIQHLIVKATNHSLINFYDSVVDTLKLYANNSKIYNVRNNTILLNATLVDSSYFKASEPLKLNITTDKTSRYTVEGK